MRASMRRGCSEPDVRVCMAGGYLYETHIFDGRMYLQSGSAVVFGTWPVPVPVLSVWRWWCSGLPTTRCPRSSSGCCATRAACLAAILPLPASSTYCRSRGQVRHGRYLRAGRSRCPWHHAHGRTCSLTERTESEEERTSSPSMMQQSLLPLLLPDRTDVQLPLPA
jgi:hypothetical protein